MKIRTEIDSIKIARKDVLAIGTLEFLRILGSYGLSIYDFDGVYYEIIGRSIDLDAFSDYWIAKFIWM